MNINEGHDRTVASDEDLPREGRCCTRATPRCAAPPPTSDEPIRRSCVNDRSCLPTSRASGARRSRSEEHTSELQSRQYLVCRLLLEKKKKKIKTLIIPAAKLI